MENMNTRNTIAPPESRNISILFTVDASKNRVNLHFLDPVQENRLRRNLDAHHGQAKQVSQKIGSKGRNNRNSIP